MKTNISLKPSNTTFKQRLDFGKCNTSYGKELRKRNWRERGKENCQDSIF